MLVMVNEYISKNMRNLAEACGIEFDSKHKVVLDHTSFIRDNSR